MSEQLPTGESTPVTQASPPANSRRQLLRGALAAPVLMAVASKPVLAGQLCAPSGFASGNTSSVDNPTACNGWSPGYWKAKPSKWPSPYRPTTKFHDVFDGSYFGSKTMMDVLELGGGDLVMLGRHCVASLLNATVAPLGYLMTPQEIKEIWRQCLNTAPSSQYQTESGLVMTLPEIEEFLKATYHQNMLAYYD